ncbi:MAG: C4-dicarboxylate TRAP transporter large permease protein DctM [Rhodocyclaceae bacterium]|nr:C4-dicarboxylate TRAP transporter large permease protein DctM [Rhodocyclaceae bacterium]
MSLLPLIFFLLLAAGLPIFVVLGVSAGILTAADGRPLIGIAQKILDELNSPTLVSVPFFVMAANFMLRGGISQALVDFSGAWLGRMHGGLGAVTVLSCTLFAAICGSSVATALAIGTIMIPAMVDKGYNRPFALGLIGASGTLGILIPPSLPMILYGILAEESIPRLFLAGVLPGLFQALLFTAWVAWYARRHGYPRQAPLSRREFLKVNLAALPAMSVPVVIAVGIYGGIVTVTEAAALAALVALLVSLFVYRGFHWREAVEVIGDSVKSSAVVMLIVATALAFGHWVTESGMPNTVVTAITEMGLSSWQFLLIINLILLVLGMFLEVASIMLITLPIIVPLLKPLGIDPVHFAVVMTINMEIALITPPVGLNLYVIASVAKAPIGEAIRGITPFLIMLLGLLATITYVPEISLWLPDLLYGR